MSSTMRLLVCAGFLGTLVGASAQPVAEKSNPAELEVSIAVPLNSAGNSRDIINYSGSGTFCVVVTNRSTKPQKVFDAGYSWGYRNLSFRVTDARGKTRTVKRHSRGFNKNFPKHYILQPGDHFIREVRFDDASWKDFPKAKQGRHLKVRIQAVFEVQPDDESRRHGVWTGRIASEERAYTIWG